MRAENNDGIPFRTLIGVLVVAVLILTAGGCLYFHHEARAIERRAYEELKAIGKLKVDQIAQWRSERLADARLNASGSLRASIQRWMRNGSSATLKADTLAYLRLLRQVAGYRNIILAAADGSPLLSLVSPQMDMDPTTKKEISRAVSLGEPVFGDFYFSPSCNRICLDVAAPIMSDDRRAMAVLVLSSDPETMLYPLINSWPLPSISGETLLVRREGNEVVYLNMLRRLSGPPLSLRVPLSRVELPAVQAVLGRTGLSKGKDYRGVAVLADILPVSGSPWYMVAKEDSSEIMAEARYRGLVTLLLVVFGVLLACGMTIVAYNRRQRNLFRSLYLSERERRGAQEEIRATLYGIGDGVIATDVEGKVTRMNQVAAGLTGWTEAEALGKQLSEVFVILNEETRCEVRNPVSIVLREGRVVGLANHTLLVARDGTEIPITDSAAPIRGELEETSGVVLVFRDQSSERVAQEALKRSESRLRRIIEATNVGTWEWNVPADELVVDERWLEILGAAPVTGDPPGIQLMLDAVNPEDRGRAETQLREVLCCERTLYDLEIRVRHRNGSWVWVHDRGKITEWKTESQPQRMTGTRVNVTDRRILEHQLQQAQKMESVGRLAGGVAHDFNNMLGVILGHVELALQYVDPAEPLHTDLIEIHKAGQRSAELTQQLLAFARKQSVSPRILDMNETISGMLAMLRRLIGEDINLSWRPGRQLWPVKVDPAQIHQILANLAVNARDAIAGVGNLIIETKNVTFDEAYCSVHHGLTPGDYVFLGIVDTGTGMAKEIQEHLFEPFFTTKEVGKGTGLGLATVYGAVKQNHGFIEVLSELGRGTTVEIHLPRVDDVASEQQLLPANPTRGSETVLLVEDEEAILNLVRTILREYGYRVLAARTPAEALDQAHSHQGPIHLLITDVVMPEMNGKDLKERIEQAFPDIRALFVSGYTADVIAHHGVIDDGVEFLQKPFSVKTLAAKVREILHR